MTNPLPILALIAGLLAALSACAATQATEAPEIGYLGAEVEAIGGDLYGFAAAMEGARDIAEVEGYVTCLVAGYARENGHGFARKVRTIVTEEGGVWSADAVYSITPALPRGLKTIDAEVVVADCAERGIPTV